MKERLGVCGFKMKSTHSGTCFICMRKNQRLINGICSRCIGGGADDSLYEAIKNKDDVLIKKIEDKVKAGQIVRIM